MSTNISIISIDYCPKYMPLFSRMSSLILWFLATLSITSVLSINTRIYKIYHLFFILLFNLMIITKIISAGIRIVGYCMILIDFDVPSYIDDALWLAKFATGASILSCMMERGYATYYAVVYESTTKHSLLGVCAFIFTVTIMLAYIEGDSVNGRKLFSISYSSVVTIVAILLTLQNRRLVIKSQQTTCQLTQRYQLTENIKALRLLHPFVIVISLNAICQSIALIIFDVDTIFVFDKCNTRGYTYIIVFFCLLLETTLCNISASVYLIVKNTKCAAESAKPKERSDIKNILGVKIIDIKMKDKDYYFQHYNSQWA